MILIICSYCGKTLGEKDPLDDKRLSHGCCKECYEKEIKKLEELEKRLNPEIKKETP